MDMSKKQKNIWLLEGVTRKGVLKAQYDTKFNFLRSCKIRRTLVVIYLLITILVVAAPTISGVYGKILGLIGCVFLIEGYLLLRSSIRHIADTPDELLDERQIALRDRTYLHSYRILVGLFSFISLVIFVRVDFNDEKFVVEHWFGFGTWYAALMLMATLPSAVLAWVDESEIEN